jgi:RNA polymerase-binding transcription factor DksA
MSDYTLSDSKFLKEMEGELLDLLADLDHELDEKDEEDGIKSISRHDFDDDEEDEFGGYEDDNSSEEVAELEEQREKVKEALQRIKDGTYGLCIHCEKPIDISKLRSMPELDECGSC